MLKTLTQHRWMMALLFLASASTAFAQSPPLGRWKTVDDQTGKPKSIVEITERDGKLYGRIVGLFRPPEQDQNPLCDKCTGELKNQPINGMTILRDFKKDGDEWSGGTIFDPVSGKTYKCYIQVLEGGARLKVRGYIGISLLGRTQYWLRMPSVETPRADAGT